MVQGLGLRGDPERRADPARRRPRTIATNTIVFIGRHDPRKGMPVLLKAWPDIHRRTGARLRLVGADPLAVQLLLARHRIPSDGIDVLGFLPQEKLTEELLRAKALAVPSVGQESFGMVLTRGFACAVPVVASDIPGYRAVMTDETGVLFPPGDDRALAMRSSGCSRTSRAGGRSASRRGRWRSSGTRGTRSPCGSSRSTRTSPREPAAEAAAVTVESRRDRARLPRGCRRAALVARAALDRLQGRLHVRSSGSGSPPRSGSTCSRSWRAPSPGTR